MSYSYQELAKLSLEELKEQHDRHATSTVMGISYFLDEIRSREQAVTNSKIVLLTKWMLGLTVVVTIATLVNVLLFILQS